jgi:hypothetical protein
MGEAAEADPVVAFMASDVALVVDILTKHVSDRSGRCRVCGDRAQGTKQQWLCRLHGYAALAWQLVPDADKPKPPKNVKPPLEDEAPRRVTWPGHAETTASAADRRSAG